MDFKKNFQQTIIQQLNMTGKHWKQYSNFFVIFDDVNTMYLS